MNGNLMVAGLLYATGAVPELFVSSYSTSGSLLSAFEWSGNQIAGGNVPGMAIGATGNILVAGGAANNSGAWAAASATSGSLPNSLVTYSYTLGTPSGTAKKLTPALQAQTGIQDVGGGGEDAFVAEYPGGLSN